MTTLDMVTPVGFSQDGPQITINTLLKSPTMIPRRVIDETKQGFLADQLLRKGSPADSGVVLYYANTPQYADTAVENIGEGGEVPVASSSVGDPAFARTVSKPLGVEITDQMARRNDQNMLNTRIAQVRNTIRRAWDIAFLTPLLAGAQTTAATAVWSGSSSKIRKDLATAIALVNGATDAQGSIFGYLADTLVVNTADATDFLFSDDVAKVFIGNIANFNPQFTGAINGGDRAFSGLIARNFFGLSVWATPNLAQGTALVLESGTVGFISDEVPLSASPLYRINQRRLWRTDVDRQSAIGIDQPKAACTITSV